MPRDFAFRGCYTVRMIEIRIAPTCVPMSEYDIATCRNQIIDFAPAIHIDIDDAVFAPLFTWPYIGPGSFAPFNLKGAEGLTVDVHLMGQNRSEERRVGKECRS